MRFGGDVSFEIELVRIVKEMNRKREKVSAPQWPQMDPFRDGVRSRVIIDRRPIRLPSDGFASSPSESGGGVGGSDRRRGNIVGDDDAFPFVFWITKTTQLRRMRWGRGFSHNFGGSGSVSVAV